MEKPGYGRTKGRKGAKLACGAECLRRQVSAPSRCCATGDPRDGLRQQGSPGGAPLSARLKSCQVTKAQRLKPGWSSVPMLREMQVHSTRV
jgi:hypothetical protein